MTGAWQLGLFAPFLGSVGYLFPCYKPGSKLTLPTEPSTAIILRNWGPLSSLEKFPNQKACTGDTREYPLCYIQWSEGQQNHHFPTGFPLEQIQGGGLICFLSSPKLYPSKTCSIPLSSSASPHQAFPPACAEIWQAAGSQGVVGKQLWMDFGSWMKELDNCSNLSEGNTEKPDPNLPILSWQCDLASVTAIRAFRFLWHQTKPESAHLPTEVWGCSMD